jgi:phosphoglycerate dehydrogenase-like enzyme
MEIRHRLLIISRDAAVYKRLIEERALPGLNIEAVDSAAKALDHIKRCTILIGEPKRIAPVIDRAARLLWVQSTFAGVESLLHPPPRTDYILSGVKDVFGPFMSEYVFSYLVAWERHAFELYRNQRKRVWQKIPYKSLKGRLIGICGLGSIGIHIAQTAEHFGLRVWGYKKTPASLPAADRVFTEGEFKEFLAGPDYIVVTLPSSPDTFHMFDQAAFEAMKSTAVLINIGRGSVISEPALIRALQEGRIAGAVLDVFDEEPLPQENPLWSLPNVFITPHISGYSFPSDIVGIFAENYRRFLSGSPLLYQIDFQRGY